MKNLSEIPAAILAGGMGTRLRSVVSDRPKVLSEVGGRPFLTYLLDRLAAVQVQKVVLCTGYLGEQVKARMGDRYRGIRLEYSREPSPLGTAGALRLALPLLASELVLVMNGDSYFGTTLRAFCAVHRLREANASIVLAEVEQPGGFGSVEVEEDGRIKAFFEKKKKAGGGWVNAGIYLLRTSLLELIPGDGEVSLENEIFPAWIGRGLYGFRCQGRFIDIGTPESFVTAEEFLSREKIL